MRLDLLMFLCSAVVLIPEPTDIDCEVLDIMSNHFAESAKRLKYQDRSSSKDDAHWPKHFYCLFRSPKEIRKQKR